MMKAVMQKVASKKILPAIYTAVIAATLIGGASISADAVGRPLVRANAYDGIWSVVIYTLQGSCDQALRYSVRIVSGRVLPEDQGYRLAGAVAPNGAIRVVVAEGGRSASGYGRLVGNRGSGRWSTSSGECAGEWVARRRVANY
jgi:hypothetical protein